MDEEEPPRTLGLKIVDGLLALFFLALAVLGGWSFYEEVWGVSSCTSRPEAACFQGPWGALTVSGRGSSVLALFCLVCGLAMVRSLWRDR
jgi:hypothetical protein